MPRTNDYCLGDVKTDEADAAIDAASGAPEHELQDDAHVVLKDDTERDKSSRRVVVVLDPRSHEALEWLTSNGLTRTTVTSRALLVFQKLLAAQMAGKQIYLEDRDSRTELAFY